ncbi:MAG: TGS domain-containing protein [Candidatus Tectomicrobia bacterium]|uniref:TGS domain-containing protein n=1 Tax=Tectimicrobiota bacterium TaxID=2528274 RepID=A0A932CQ16_UNCTE|nr:TGS domain-containing protein [Candidatus Tectomicrobia bacterium]
MPANLPPQYFEVERRYREAKSPQEKLRLLEELLAIIPKHKGTEHLQGDLRRRISKLKAESQRKKGATTVGYGFHVEREGAGQGMLVGPPNTGKSLLLASLTNATPEVADYPFTTRRPLPGMMPFENVQIQLVDLPPLSPDFTEPWLSSALRGADLLLLVIDLGQEDVLEQVEQVKEGLARWKIVLGRADEDRAEGVVARKALLVGNKLDAPGAGERYELLREIYGEELPMVAVSALQGRELEELKRAIYKALEVIRIYTKPPGKEPDLSNPTVLKQGSTIEDVAASVHQEFVHRLKYARVWGKGSFEGQRVHRNSVVQEGDIVELHV